MWALRDCWNWGTRNASGEDCRNGRAMNCCSCMGSPISRGDMVRMGLRRLFGERNSRSFDVGRRNIGPGLEVARLGTISLGSLFHATNRLFKTTSFYFVHMFWLLNQTRKCKATIEIWFNFFVCSETGVCECETPYHANATAAMTLLYLTTEKQRTKRLTFQPQ